MKPPTKPWTHDRAQIAAITRGIRAGERRPDDPQLDDAYRNLREKRLAEHIEKVLAQAPPLTAEQRDRLATILTAGGGSA
jgi:hypothetical protein